MGDGERRTRSRFDQAEPPRRSRFDRRSRSPGGDRKPASERERSPLDPGVRDRERRAEASKSPVNDPAAAAAAAAARINEQINARKPSHPEAPPSRPISSAASPPAHHDKHVLHKEIYVEDGDYIRDIEVNDLRNRYTLTKGSTQKMIKDETGADITTRGSYLPDKNMATPQNPPLYLHITSQSKEGLEKAIAKIEELMKQELPNLIDERRFRRREPEQPVERDEFGRRKWPEEKIPVGLDPIPGFNLRAQVVGQGGAYVKHIQQETRCRVQIKGRGSGFIEHSTGRESDEPMFLHVAGPNPDDVKAAKELCEDLLANVKEQYRQFKETPHPPRGYGHHGGYGNRERYNNHHHHGGYGGGSYGGGYGGGYAASPHNGQPTPISPSPAPGAQANAASANASPAPTIPAATSATDYAAQYAQYYGGADPYAAYGGYQNYVAYYQYYQQYAQQQQQQQSQQQPEAGSAQQASGEAPPPPPPSGSPPPPPPSGAYSAVPPPPGL